MWNIIPILFKTGAEIFKNSQATKIAMSLSYVMRSSDK
jgi:hypothetical protein